MSAALDYGRRGWPVVPLGGDDGKNPQPLLGKGWPRKATTDPAIIEGLFCRWPEANVGVLPGDRFIAFDVDRRHGDDDRLHDLERELGPLPLSPRYVTGDGERLLLEHPGVELHGQIEGIKVIHGPGRQIVMPTSVHRATGRLYEWDVHPDDMPLRALSPAWLERLTAPPRGVSTPTPPEEWLRIVRDGVEEGERNATAARLAGHLLAKRLDPDVGLELLRAWNAARCRPPLEERELERVWESIARRELEKRRRAA